MLKIIITSESFKLLDSNEILRHLFFLTAPNLYYAENKTRFQPKIQILIFST